MDKNNNANAKNGNNEEAEIIEQAKTTAIEYLKNKYELKVEITKKKYFQHIKLTKLYSKDM